MADFLLWALVFAVWSLVIAGCATAVFYVMAAGTDFDTD